MTIFLDKAEFANSVNRQVIEHQIANPKMTFVEQTKLAEDIKTAEAEKRTIKYQELTRIGDEAEAALKIETEAEIIALRAGDRRQASKERDAEMRRQAEFWKKYKLEILALEEEERIAQAKFWFEYKKQVLLLEQRARENEGRSTLHFGLFR
jgi:hypothetical protein